MIAATNRLLAMAVMAGAATVAAQEPISKSQSVSTTATIQAIDATTRSVTLRDEKGQEDTFTVGAGVKRFDELKVGDQVKFTYYESVVLQVRKPGDPAPTGTSGDAALTRGKGELPGATLAVQDKTSVTVKSIDPAMPSVTVTTADGRTVTRKIENKKYLEGLKPGDVVDIVYTRALVTEIERAK
jgi:Cu/Ag efflux protein CusF